MLRKENVLIRAGRCSLTVLPRLGGKIASIRFAGSELLQAPLLPAVPRTRTMSFDESDASGWDECLPSVAACSVLTPAGSAEVPDHGDLWREAWRVDESSGNAVSLTGECFSLPLRLQRTLEMIETPIGCHVALRYALTNTGTYEVPWSWAAHPLFACEPGDSLRLPESITSLRLEGSGANRLGKSGDSVSWPIAVMAAGGETNLSHAGEANSGIGEKLFTGPLSESENWCEILRPRAGVRIRMRFDPARTPYLGLWLCYGGWPERPGPKQMCIAPEPCTAPVDSLAATGPWSRTLAAGETCRWTMDLELETLTKVN
ncbi:MAG TPA: hypothetical protein VFU68_00560 [Terracidiphilus sp.]|nr:hypothetical protein [Terracidiphilus sp.]